MDYHTVATLHKQSPVFSALRKDWLPLAVSFLHLAFKQRHEVALPQDTLREQLDAYLEHVNSTLSPDKQLNPDPDYYIDRWSRDDDMIRIRSREQGYVVQLSPHAERLIGWFDELQSRGIIGTESRLRTILSLLDEVVTQSTEDVQTRLNYLYEQREQLDAEIDRIEETGDVKGLTDVQVRERLEQINGMASQLLRDFSAVEERFRDIARDIQQAQLDPTARRGEIVATALDADEHLEQSDEGQSFRAFYELLTHPDQRQTFDSLLGALFKTPRLRTATGDNALLQRLTSHLLDAGDRVNQSNQRLAEHLRRVVDTRNIIESRRVQTLAAEIKHMAGRLPAEDHERLLSPRRRFFTIEGDPQVDLPLERPLYDPPEELKPSARPRPATETLDVDVLSALYDTFRINDTLLRENIARLLMSRAEVTLAEVAASYPIEQGIAEVVAYVLIAAHEASHTVDRAHTDEITFTPPGDDTPRRVRLPRLIFRRQLEPDHAG